MPEIDLDVLEDRYMRTAMELQAALEEGIRIRAESIAKCQALNEKVKALDAEMDIIRREKRDMWT